VCVCVRVFGKRQVGPGYDVWWLRGDLTSCFERVYFLVRENLLRLKVMRLFLSAKPSVLGPVPSSNIRDIRDDEISPERFL
jgi:hypothetical protein